MSKLLWSISIALMIFSAYLIYKWLISEPGNQEPLPALLSLIATIIMGIGARQYDSRNRIRVRRIKQKSSIKLDITDDSDVSVSNVSGQSKVRINKGIDSTKIDH